MVCGLKSYNNELISLQIWMSVLVELVNVTRRATTTMALTHALVKMALH